MFLSCVTFGYLWLSMLVCFHRIGGWGQRCGRQWRRQFLRLPSATCHHSSTGPFLVQPPGSRAQRRRGAAEKSPMPLCHSECPGALIPLHLSFTPHLTIFSDSFSFNEMQRCVIGKWHGIQVVYWLNFEMLRPGPVRWNWSSLNERFTAIAWLTLKPPLFPWNVERLGSLKWSSNLMASFENCVLNLDWFRSLILLIEILFVIRIFFYRIFSNLFLFPRRFRWNWVWCRRNPSGEWEKSPLNDFRQGKILVPFRKSSSFPCVGMWYPRKRCSWTSGLTDM